MKKGDLIMNRLSNKTGTITSTFVKVFRDESDWEACAAGFDSGYAATAVTVFWHETGTERVHERSKLKRNHKVIEGANNESS